MNIYTKILKKKKLVIFDLDGVLLNSRENMKAAWDYTSKCNNLTLDFNQYFKHVGLPFFTILEKMGIKGNYLKIKKNYSKGKYRLKRKPNFRSRGFFRIRSEWKCCCTFRCFNRRA